MVVKTTVAFRDERGYDEPRVCVDKALNALDLLVLFTPATRRGDSVLFCKFFHLFNC